MVMNPYFNEVDIMPSLRRPSLLCLLSVTALGASACDSAPLAAEVNRYEACGDFQFADEPASICGDGETECRRSPHSWGGGLCTASCSVDADCPTLDGQQIVCERFAVGGHQCVATCDPESDSCPGGTACTEMDYVGASGAVSYCMP
jgi:hypothetical protein